MTNVDRNTNGADALQRIASTEFEQAFADYKAQRDAVEPLGKVAAGKGNPFNALDDAFTRMMKIPAPTLDALIRKMEATTGDVAENCGWETQYHVAQLIADARRLNGDK